MSDPVWRPSALDVAAGYPVGSLPRDPQRPDIDSVQRWRELEESPSEALEAVLRPAVHATPCIVAFSGGRDSSLVLAAALRLARREGVPEPVAYTQRFPNAPSTFEDGWQETVARQVGLRHWDRREFHDELDIVGPIAQSSLRRWGLLWTPMLHLKAPMLDAARGGVLVTGEGGDSYLEAGRARWPKALVAHRRRMPYRYWPRALENLAPRPVRYARSLARYRPSDRPWLTPRAHRAFARGLASDAAGEPLLFERRLDRLGRLRGHLMGLHNRRLMASAEAVDICDPLMHPRFLAALLRGAGPLGYANRTAVLKRFFADLLPADLMSRVQKANFNDSAFGEHFQSFVRSWDGEGIDHRYVDVERLLNHVLSQPMSGAAVLNVQRGWMVTHGGAT